MESECRSLTRPITLEGRHYARHADYARAGVLTGPDVAKAATPTDSKGRQQPRSQAGRRTITGSRKALSLLSLGLIAAGVKRELADHKPSCHFDGRTRPSAL